jgi:hypothetical protein
VARILGDGKRQRTRVFTELQSHYLFEDRFGRPGKGNDKGKVEGLVGYARRNFLVPIPVFESFEALNANLLDCCRKRMGRLRGQHRLLDQSVLGRQRRDHIVMIRHCRVRRHDQDAATRLAVDAFSNEVKSLAERDRPPQVVICALPVEVIERVSNMIMRTPNSEAEEDDTEEERGTFASPNATARISEVR